MSLENRSRTVTMLALMIVAYSASAMKPLQVGDDLDQSRWGYAPAWIDLGHDARGKRVWLRLDRYTFDSNADGEKDIPATDSKLYANGVLVRHNAYRFANIIFCDSHFVARVGSASMVFSEWSYGAGSTWHVSYNLIDRRTYKLLAYGNFEHGDWTDFERTHLFLEYRYLKYQDLHRDELATHPFQKFIWHWDVKRRRFYYEGGCFSKTMTGRPGAEWDFDVNSIKEHLERSGGDAGSYNVAGLSRFGFPGNTRVEIDSYDGLGLYIGRKRVAELPIRVGETEVERPPSAVKARNGALLTFVVYEQDHVRRYNVRIQRDPYKLTVLDSHVEKEWTPFSK